MSPRYFASCSIKIAIFVQLCPPCGYIIPNHCLTRIIRNKTRVAVTNNSNKHIVCVLFLILRLSQRKNFCYQNYRTKERANKKKNKLMRIGKHNVDRSGLATSPPPPPPSTNIWVPNSLRSEFFNFKLDPIKLRVDINFSAIFRLRWPNQLSDNSSGHLVL